jgi:SpoVK/Ycf46/Vps4 family AAA+-type ATPase
MSLTDADCLARLLRARQPCVYLPTLEESYARHVIRTAAADRHILEWRVTTGLRDGVVRDQTSIPDTEHPAGAMTHLMQHPPHKSVVVMLDLACHLKDERTLRCLRDAIDVLSDVETTIVLVDPGDDLPPVIRASAQRLELSLPGAKELDDLVRTTVRELHGYQKIDVQLRKEDLAAIVQNLQGLSRRQAREAVIDAISEDRRLDASDVPRIIAFKKRALRSMGVLEPIETLITMDEIGGMGHLKKWLNLRSRALADDAVEFGVEPPRGILMLGVQGAGKSLSAKAVATAWRRPLVRMDVGALFDRYIGESERRLRDALRQAESMAPVVLWIDEIEKAFASAASQSIDGGLGKRMFGGLLTWMQEHTRPVFVIATANDVSALPPELLRKGRFDEIFFVDLPKEEARRQIFQIHLKKRQRDPELFDLPALVAASEGYSGAEIESAIKAAIYVAYEKGAFLGTQSVLDAMKGSPPLSVTMAEGMTRLREWAKGRCVPAE